jgi:preprotein translocase subunit SecB
LNPVNFEALYQQGKQAEANAEGVAEKPAEIQPTTH